MSSGAAFALLFMLGLSSSEAAYFGKDLGALSELHHGVKGRVFAVDSRTLYLKDFHYDGEGPAAYFYVGSSKAPHATGAVRLRDERGATNPLRRYRGEPVTLSLPEGTSLKDVKWFSVWCDEFSVNFGDVKIPRELDYPKPAKIGALSGVHGVSSDPIVVVDAQTLLVPNFSYDGEAPDAKFWVGRGDKPSPQGIRIPDENGKENPLRRYDRKTIVLTLPGELTVFDIGHFSVWCEAFTVNFGHVTLPRSKLSNVPPSLKMLGISPQKRNQALAGASSQSRRPPSRNPGRSSAHVDATTYRPSRLGAGPLAALLEQSDEHNLHLHRRADNYKPPQEQLTQAVAPRNEQYQKQQEIQNQQDVERLYYQQQEQIQRLQELLYQHQKQQSYQQQQQQQYQPQQIPQDQLYQQQLYNQQRQSYNQELLSQQYRQQDPVQYRLLPYQYDGSSPQSQFQGHTIVDPIQRSIDLDLDAGSGSQ